MIKALCEVYEPFYCKSSTDTVQVRDNSSKKRHLKTAFTIYLSLYPAVTPLRWILLGLYGLNQTVVHNHCVTWRRGTGWNLTPMFGLHIYSIGQKNFTLIISQQIMVQCVQIKFVWLDLSVTHIVSQKQTSTSVFGEGRISTHADPTSTRRAISRTVHL